jgi:general secretion pathway protein G
MPMHRSRTIRLPAFSMMELVIVMLIMGVLAAIAIPRIGTGSERAKAEAVAASLAQVRTCIEVYKAEHQGRIPDLQFVAQMTQYTDDQGNTSADPSPKLPFGPYLRDIPRNPYSGSATVRFLTSAGQAQEARSVDRGWTYNVATGEFAADCSDTRVTVDTQATPLNKL